MLDYESRINEKISFKELVNGHLLADLGYLANIRQNNSTHGRTPRESYCFKNPTN